MSLLDRFCRYVAVETTAIEDSLEYPSSPGQRELGAMLVQEMTSLGMREVSQSEHGVVMGTVPGTVDGAPTIAWLAHMDTSPDASGKNVRPNVIRDYDGKDIVLSGDPSKVIRVGDTAGLAALRGKTLISTDGTTLLGADDKTGIAVIMTAAAKLLGESTLKHGDIRCVFTTDEEVGRGTDKVDIAKINAAVAYTLDGEGAGDLENETFSADQAVVSISGVNIHPGLAHGKMINALRLAGAFLECLPADMAPETTQDREAFLHPYSIDGDVSAVEIRLILRSFETAKLEEQARLLHDAAKAVATANPGATIDVKISKQYRNMGEYLDKDPRAVELAAAAFKRLGIEPAFRAIRGGTDGSRLSELGLPCPNLSSGMHNYHSVLEYACLEEMETAVSMLIELAQVWGEELAD